MNRLLPLHTAIFGFLAASVPGAALAGSFTYTTIGTNSQGTGLYLSGINDSDQVVGYETGKELRHRYPTSALFWQNGKSILIEATGAFSTGFQAINDNGVAVGGYIAKIRNPPGVFTVDTATGSQQVILPFAKKVGYTAAGINGNGEIVGSTGNGHHHYVHGYLWNGSGTMDFQKTQSAVGIDNAGDVALNQSGTSAIYTAGNYIPIQIPGAADTYLFFMTPSGSAGGVFADSQGNNHGFTWEQGTVSTFDYPKASQTIVWGVGPSGEVFGTAIVKGGFQAFVNVSGKNYPLRVPGFTQTTVIAANALGSFIGYAYPKKDGDAIIAFIAQCPSGQFPCTQ
jgi:hypothetical protein